MSLRGVLAVIFLFSTPLFPRELVVDPDGTGDHTGIQAAIDAAGDGDTVRVKAGEYALDSPVNFHGKAIRVHAESGPGETILRMKASGSVALFMNGETHTSVLEGFTLTGGTGDNRGGGVRCEDSSPTLTGCVITKNRASLGAGGVYCLRSSPTLSDCTISRNRANWGAGIACDTGSSPFLTNCVISGNLGTTGAGVYSARGAAPTLHSSTIAGNTTHEICIGFGICIGGDGAGLFALENATATFVNCVIWGNAGPGEAIALQTGASASISHSCVEGDEVWPGIGNINADPLFFDASSHDYRLAPGSPAIDAGASEGAPESDRDGVTRPCGAGVDMGAHESGRCGLPPATFIRGDVDGSGRFTVQDAVMGLGYIFAFPRPAVACVRAIDYDDSGRLTLSDMMDLLYHVFERGEGPPLPYPDCGLDSTPDDLPCDVPPPVCRTESG